MSVKLQSFRERFNIGLCAANMAAGLVITCSLSLLLNAIGLQFGQ